MSPAITESSPIDYLIALKSHFEQELSEADAKVANLREQLEHVDALLLNQLVPAHGVTPLQEQIETPPPPELFLNPQVETPTEQLDLAPTQTEPETFSSSSETSETIAAPEPTAPQSSRSRPRVMLPAYQELTRMEAITTVLLAHQDEAVTADTLTQELFGTLSKGDHKAEAKRLKTLLYKGEKSNLWQKGRKPSSYLIKGTTAKSKARRSKKGTTDTGKTSAAAVTEATQTPAKTAAKPVAASKASNSKRKAATKAKSKTEAPNAKRGAVAAKTNGALTLQSPYREMSKNEAIISVLEHRAGKAVHRDAIIESLYGDLSSEDLKAERKRMTTVLHRGIKTNKWQRADAPSSVLVLPTAKDATSNRPGRQSKAPKKKSKPVGNAAAENAPVEAEQSTKATKATASKAKTPAKTEARTTRRRATRTKAAAKK